MYSVPLIVAGAIGNLADRIHRGYVVDFIRFHVHNQWEWPTFNVADMWISIGVTMLMIDGILEGRREKRAAQALQAQEQQQAEQALPATPASTSTE